MVILAELGHLRNVNRAREGIKCHRNNAHMLTFQWSLKSFLGIRIRKGFSFHYSDKCECSYCHCDSQVFILASFLLSLN